MLNVREATNVIRKELPFGKIQAVVEYRNLYLFQVFGDDPLEGQLDPFFSVDKETGDFAEFSILTDGDISEVTSLFVAAKERNRNE